MAFRAISVLSHTLSYIWIVNTNHSQLASGHIDRIQSLGRLWYALTRKRNFFLKKGKNGRFQIKNGYVRTGPKNKNNDLNDNTLHIKSIQFGSSTIGLLTNFYYPTALSRVQITRETSTISRDIVRLFGQLVILYCKKNLFDRLAALTFIVVISVKRGENRIARIPFKVLLLKERPINPILPSLWLFHSLYWSRNYNWHRYTVLGSSRMQWIVETFSFAELSWLQQRLVYTKLISTRYGTKGKKSGCK